MMMRSMPPASSHLAESPVPAPPPMIGSPWGIIAGTRASSSSRVKRLIRGKSPLCDLAEGRDERLGEFRVVDVMRQLDELVRVSRREICFERREQGIVRRAVEEGLALQVEGRDALHR